MANCNHKLLRVSVLNTTPQIVSGSVIGCSDIWFTPHWVYDNHIDLDSLNITYTKPLDDIQNLEDVYVSNYYKYLEEFPYQYTSTEYFQGDYTNAEYNFYIFDNVSILGNKTISDDSNYNNDGYRITFGKLEQELLYNIDVCSVVYHKPLETLVVDCVDGPHINYNKNITELPFENDYSVYEYFAEYYVATPIQNFQINDNQYLIYGKGIDDEQVFSDIIVFNNTKQLGDTQNIIDATFNTVGKYLAELPYQYALSIGYFEDIYVGDGTRNLQIDDAVLLS